MPSPEIEAMGSIEEALGAIDEDARLRVLKWAVARFAQEPLVANPLSLRNVDTPGQAMPAIAPELQPVDADPMPVHSSFDHFAELYDHCDPSGPQERFLVSAYWLQIHEGRSSFGNADINKLLREQGAEDANLNKLVDRLRKSSPKPVSQLAGGAADKSRKVLKLTAPGIKSVEEMILNGA